MIIERQSIGRREEQQDAYFSVSRNGVIFAVVADGLGGMQAGQEASKRIVREAKILFNTETPDLATAERFLKKFKDNAQKAILEFNKEMGIDSRSTVVALLTMSNKAFVMHSGDSRCYRFLKDKLVSRTRDHSVSQLLFEQGKISEEEIGTHPDQGKLFNCLGGVRGNDCDIESFTIAPGEWFLLCTDGFWEHLSQEELSSLYLKTPEQADKLLNRAVKNGGSSCDNVTFITVYPSVNPLSQLVSAFKGVSLINWAIALLFALLFALFIAYFAFGGKKGGEQKNQDTIQSFPSDPSETQKPKPHKYPQPLFSTQSVSGEISGDLEKSKIDSLQPPEQKAEPNKTPNKPTLGGSDASGKNNKNGSKDEAAQAPKIDANQTPKEDANLFPNGDANPPSKVNSGGEGTPEIKIEQGEITIEGKIPSPKITIKTY